MGRCGQTFAQANAAIGLIKDSDVSECSAHIGGNTGSGG
jgi:hypothetical protein